MDLHVTQFETGDDGVAIVRFNRPGRGNSWTNRMNAEYRWIMDRLDNDPDVRVIVVTGAGRQFCVGADFKALQFYEEGDKDYQVTVSSVEMAKPGYGVREDFDHDLVWHWGMHKPVIAAINGACAGIAVAIAAFADFRFAVTGAKITPSTARLGLPAEYALAWVLPRILGVANAAQIMLTGRIILSEEAQKLGFVSEVFPEDGFMDSVLAFARDMAAVTSPVAVGVMKRQLYVELLSGDVGGAIERSKELINGMMKLPDFKEGTTAMARKRPPQFAPLNITQVDGLIR
ncbi:MAG: enoyl-CoA hydratase/isomerase family protein [Thiothrix sp.]|nr:enoyl-CoA hydratase/isomerase family protein [Thiothrix sp.]HPQ94088.1 enoyl-CoA hydratase-related protein [Thiolinea sp.]